MGTLLALASALCYGLSDFVGGLLARRVSFAATALLGQVGGLVLAAVLAPLTSAGPPGAAAVGWGALSGVGTGIGMTFLFRGLAKGAMTVVVPVSAVGGIALPVLVGVALLGERPSVLAWLGIAAAGPALWLVANPRNGTGGAVAGLVAGAGIAVQYLALAQAGPAAGLWPVLAGRVTAILTVLPLAVATHARLRMPVGTGLSCAATGVAAALALSCYLAATHHQLVVVAVVLSSLYPAIPVVLGIVLLRERLGRGQVVGLVGAAASIALLTVP